MRRRAFITLLGSAAAGWPLAASAQHSKLPTVGYLGANNVSTEGERLAAFIQRLRELGWIDGRTVGIEIRWAEARQERFAEIAAEFVRLKVDVIVTAGTTAVIKAKQATSAIPIVFAVAGDPVGTGLVASLARPGGNITGLSLQTTELVGKRLELLREIMPGLGRIAVVADIDSPVAILEMRQVEATAHNLGLDVVTSEIRSGADIVPAFDAFKERAHALYIVAGPLMTTNRIRINTLALGAQLPTMAGQGDNVEAGGLISYGANFPDLYRRAADYVNRILRGANPADLPVEQPTKFDLVINLTTAKALGITIPPALVARADEVIE